MEQLAVILNSQNVLAALAVVVVVGFGLFIDRRVWPWWITWADKWWSDSVALKNKQLELQEKNDMRWYRTSESFIREMQTTAVTLAVVRKTAEDTLLQIYGIREKLEDLEGFVFDDPESPK